MQQLVNRTAGFTIVSGAHQGARFDVNEGLLLVGADASCDVWLSDPGLASRHLALMADDNGLVVRPLEGAVHMDGREIASATHVATGSTCEITLGDSGVRLRLDGVAGQPAREVNDAPAEPVRPAAAMTRLAGVLCGRGQKSPRFIAAALLVLFGLLAAGVSIQELRPAHAAAANRAGAAGSAELDLVNQVRDVFRLHGYDAEVTSAEGSSVRVENLDEQNERVRRAVQQLRADLPQLQSVSFAAPEKQQPPGDPPLYDDLPERMSVHVLEGTAYLSARDGRYFVGSVLPNGDTIRRITAHAVQIDRDGQLSWFRF